MFVMTRCRITATNLRRSEWIVSCEVDPQVEPPSSVRSFLLKQKQYKSNETMWCYVVSLDSMYTKQFLLKQKQHKSNEKD